MLAAGKAAVNGSRTARMGIDYAPPGIDFGRVHDHVKSVIAGIAPMLGFIGTISGIIRIFYDISLSDNISVGIIAGGLYEKMITSGAGLIVGLITTAMAQPRPERGGARVDGAAREAMRKGARVVGYFYWSMFDNVEWVDGTSKRFGLVYVDYDGKFGEKMKRYPKKSLEHYSAYMRGEHAEEPALGASKASSSMKTFGARSQGEALAMRGFGITFACVFAIGALAKRIELPPSEDLDERSTLVV